MQAQIVTEIAFSFPNEPGVLAKTARALADANIGIKGMLNFSRGSNTQTYMVLSSGIEKAIELLKEQGIDSVGQGNVIEVQMEGDVGPIAELAEKLSAAGVNMENIYVCESPNGTSTMYVSTNDDDKAVEVLSA